MSRDVKFVDSIQSRRNELMKEINETYQELEERNIQTGNDTERTILLLGSAKCGKTTLRHMLNDPRHVSDQLTLLSLPSEELICHRNVCPQTTHLYLTIVELPSPMIMPNNDLRNINEACDRIGVNQFHLICFCTTIMTGINGQDVKLFQRLINHFGKEMISDKLCLIVTGCESKDDEQRVRLRDELERDFHFSTIAKYFGQGIHFSGALHRDDWNRANDTLYEQFLTVYEYRQDLLCLIRSDLKPLSFQSRPTESERSPSPTQESRLFKNTPTYAAVHSFPIYSSFLQERRPSPDLDHHRQLWWWNIWLQCCGCCCAE